MGQEPERRLKQKSYKSLEPQIYYQNIRFLTIMFQNIHGKILVRIKITFTPRLHGSFHSKKLDKTNPCRHFVYKVTSSAGLGLLKYLFSRSPWAVLIQGSACLTTRHKVAGSIPGTSTILNVNGEWKRLHNDELHSLYRAYNIG